MENNTMISIVVPVLNEAESLSRLVGEIVHEMHRLAINYEILFVDDGSTDESWPEIQRLASGDLPISGIRFRRNFGKASALSAGFKAARGSRIITMDADLQDNPKEIGRFVTKMDEGFDVVSGWKKVRHDPWHKTMPSKVFNWLVSWVTGVRLHDHNCGFKAYRREIFDEVRLYGQLHRFVPVLATARGWRIGEITVDHRPREFGKSKYGLGRIPGGLLDLLTVKFLTGFGQRPQHLLGHIGLLGFGFGFAGLAWLTASWCLSRAIGPWEDVHLHQRALFYYSLAALVLGAQFMSVGILAELFTAYHSRDTDAYSVSEQIGDGIPLTNHQATPLASPVARPRMLAAFTRPKPD